MHNLSLNGDPNLTVSTCDLQHKEAIRSGSTQKVEEFNKIDFFLMRSKEKNALCGLLLDQSTFKLYII